MTRKTKKGIDIRGLMLDPARLTERYEYYIDLIPQLAEWGFNTLWWHFSDDQGCALKLDSHPELASPYALTKAQTRRLVARAVEVGIDVVPEVETLGHGNYITRLPQYAHLRNGTNPWLNACCPSHPQTLEIMGDIITEVADLFPSQYLHAGLDETDISGCDHCRRRGRGKDDGWVYVQHVKAINKIVSTCGKRMIMWADHIEHNPKLLGMLPKEITLCHWQYYFAKEELVRRSLSAGFEVICAPSFNYDGTVIQPCAASFGVLDDTTDIAVRLADKGVRGVVNTSWVPWRVLRDADPFTIAYTGCAMRAAKPLDKRGFARRFARSYFGMDDSKATAALWRMHELAPDKPEFQAMLFSGTMDLIDTAVYTRGDGFAARAEEIAACAGTLAAARRRVRLHKAEYNATVLAARVGSLCLNNAVTLAGAYELYRLARTHSDYRLPCGGQIVDELNSVAEAFASLQPSLDEITELVSAEWDRTRHARDVKKHTTNISETPCPPDSLMGRLVRCRAYNRRLVRDLKRSIKAYRRGGRFPDLVNG